MLTIFDGQAVFSRLPGCVAPLDDRPLFRLAHGSRTLIKDANP